MVDDGGILRREPEPLLGDDALHVVGQDARGRFASQLWGSPSQQPSLKRQRGHCQVPWIHFMSAEHRQQCSATAISEQ